MKLFPSAYKIGYVFLLLLFSVKHSSAQDVDRIARLNNETAGTDFFMPKGYVECDSGKLYRFNDSMSSVRVYYTIENKKEGVKIGFSYLHFPSEAAIKRIREKYNSPFFRPDQNHLKIGKKRADTLHHAFVIYPKEYSLEKFNADNAGIYTAKTLAPYEEGYPLNKVVFIFKDKRGSFEIYYFYNKKAEKNIEKIIKETAGLLKFREQ